MAFMTYINVAFLTGLLFVIFLLFFGAGGGFLAAFKLGQLALAIPTWAWFGIALVFLFGTILGGK